MAQGFHGWSLSAATNANSDATCPFPEGMAPSALNDGTRAMMARLREFGNDISCTIATGGTSTALTITTAQNYTSLALLNGQIIGFLPHTTSGTPCTLNCDGLGAKPLRTAPGVELPAGVLAQGTPYVCTYSSANAEFYLRGFYALPSLVPIGGFLPYCGSSAPNANFVLPFGQAISRTTYSALFALTSTTFGVGDGSTTFNVPDLRGRAVFGQGNMGGADIGLISAALNTDGTVRGGTGGGQSHTLSIGEMPSHNHGGATGSHIHGMSQTIGGLATGIVAQSGGTGININPTGSLNTDSATASISSQGGGGAHTIMPPYMILPYILRII